MVENVSPGAAWRALREDPEAVLCDVRTEPEWSFVGLPDLRGIGKEPALVSWQVYPSMQQNPHFLRQLQEAGVVPANHVFFICRTGGRSAAAALAAAAAGYAHVFNVADGFEGPPDAEGKRGAVAGWKAEDLPWRQA